MKTTARVDSDKWRYVQTTVNPADCLSQGLEPRVLLTTSTTIWWKGPPWLSQDPKYWPCRPDINLNRELPELRTTVLRVSAASEELGLDVSTYDRLIRVKGWVIRFFSRARGKQNTLTSSHLTLSELKRSESLLLKHSQMQFYQDVFQKLKSEKSLPNGHPLSSLSPYLDREGLLRVGGRLQRAELSSSCAHPLILNARSHIVMLMVRRTHQLLLHTGSSTVMATLASTYHIPRLRLLVRSISQKCVPCQRAYARTSQQFMGELPAVRSQPSRPFTVVGIDFAGPIFIKRGNPRQPTMVKCYLCVFVCFSSRATHLEVVSDMTTPAFLATLVHFTARRGLPSKVYMDNGSNFVGAEAELRKTLEILRSNPSQQAIIQWAAHRHISWHFSPARAPHFGGLWEAAVKSVKSLLKRTLGERRLTFEELSTVVTEAEAVINSRPLIPLNSPSDDAISPLTPGHVFGGWSSGSPAVSS